MLREIYAYDIQGLGVIYPTAMFSAKLKQKLCEPEKKTKRARPESVSVSE